jgi:two-component system, NarL family, response regulator LiaR
MPKEMIKVLVVDDHPIFRRGLCAEINLDPDMKVIAEAKDGLEAVEFATRLNPDVVLMDAVMPRKNGIEATAEIVKNNPYVRVLILTSFSEDERMLAAVKAGAMGYILKDRHPEEVLQAIRDLYNGKSSLDPNIARNLLRDLPPRREIQSESILTKREMEVMKFVAHGVPNKEIARKLHVEEATVRSHVGNILGKLDLANRSQLILYAVRKGWVDDKDDAPEFHR